MYIYLYIYICNIHTYSQGNGRRGVRQWQTDVRLASGNGLHGRGESLPFVRHPSLLGRFAESYESLSLIQGSEAIAVTEWRSLRTSRPASVRKYGQTIFS